MRKYSVVLFDLDGTLSDPKIGITKSVQYALSKMGIEEKSLEKLESFIGPPLHESFASIYGFRSTEVDRAIKYYRERFKEKGMYENTLYAGIENLLKSLKEMDYTLAVATSKPTIFSEQILEYFKIKSHFDLIVGSNLDGTHSAKTEIIQYLLEHFQIIPPSEFIMIGDRKHDIIGATNTNIHSIGVTYGYGSTEELTEAHPTYLVHAVHDILPFFRR
ncbi:phosphoglycolate phosphatase [Salirhabdus euzebyi]|uniref:Phosphoglycolate phosphatase n=1 Tax=Salirhabdus euzebyi TaxID=394506 RepID=A0A841PV84_9BACI|nr:HAD family hydrolase [Salirhabdus euzebyi]MBB6452720.1 phosphoglycolate phosphatase [Salirhabdus euzebyi]